ncbi:MAG: hypothetical protein UY21_C0001G0023 [Microgenomates group bacterium GW2011_GWA1_48_10]|nr:MAG: hypothetical protein UY21_C0001G0023 [Microgenomates group bacterium GW2011_GWA1_48_10]
MALEKQDLTLLLRLRKQYPEGKNLCILGDCTFHFTDETLNRKCGIKFKGQAKQTTLKSFSQAYGFETAVTIDIDGNPTLKFDLQKKLPRNLIGKFDWVIDAGTLFWCFDIAGIWENILLLLKPHGCVFHIDALTGYFGRGYYSLHPRLFSDFYSQNGLKIITFAYRLRPPSLNIIEKRFRRLEWQPFPPSHMFLKNADKFNMEFSDKNTTDPSIVPNDAVLACFAVRAKKVPFQTVLPSNI